jgi:hypothetical protein
MTGERVGSSVVFFDQSLEGCGWKGQEQEQLDGGDTEQEQNGKMVLFQLARLASSCVHVQVHGRMPSASTVDSSCKRDDDERRERTCC